MIVPRTGHYAMVDLANQYFESRKFKRVFSIEEILLDLSEALSCPVTEIKSKSRKRELVLVRQIYFYVCRKKTKETLKITGQFIGDRDHTTVIHSAQVIEDLIQTNNEQFILYWNKYISNSKLFTENDFT